MTKPYYPSPDGDVVLYHGDCRAIMAELADGSVDAIVCDPPYPEISRPYGRLTEPQWHELMREVVAQSRRVLTDKGSAVYILQPNSERVGRMRPWLWEFMAWTAREWNQVQDAWWWNPSTPPSVHCQRKRGLMRPSVKACVWLGGEGCYRSQDEILLRASEATASDKRIDRHELGYSPAGYSMRHGRALAAFRDRGGVTPFNMTVCSNTDAFNSGGAHGHGAATPMPLTRWWARYITPPGGTILDPFAGSGTTLLAARAEGMKSIGIEQSLEYCKIIVKRLKEQSAKEPLLEGVA